MDKRIRKMTAEARANRIARLCLLHLELMEIKTFGERERERIAADKERQRRQERMFALRQHYKI